MIVLRHDQAKLLEGVLGAEWKVIGWGAAICAQRFETIIAIVPSSESRVVQQAIEAEAELVPTWLKCGGEIVWVDNAR